MYQHVNLYQPVFRQQPKLLSAATLMTITVIIAALMAALYCSAYATRNGLQRTSDEMSDNYFKLNTQLAAVTLENADVDSSVTGSEIQNLQNRLQQQYAVIEQVDTLLSEAGTGFSEVFESLAKTRFPGLWITGIELDETSRMEISGSTLDPELVPRFLEKITEFPALADLNDAQVIVARSDTRPTELEFVLVYDIQGP